MLEKIFGVSFGKNEGERSTPAAPENLQPINVYIPSELSSFQEEIMFNSDFRSTLCWLEQKLHTAEDTKTIILQTVKTCCKFYEADWCGVLIADRNTRVWSAKFWYDRAADGMAPSLIRDNEFFEYFPHWVESLNMGDPIVIPDVEAIKAVYPDEYEGYQRLEVRNVLGAPFGENPTGFLVVKNAKRYRMYPDMVQMLAFVSLSQYYLGEFIDSTPEDAAEAKKVRINLFGSPAIIYRGTITSVNNYRAPKAWPLLVYLTLSKRPKSAYEIANTLWPDDKENQSENVRGLVYRIRDKLAQKIPKDMIINENSSGYQMNPSLILSTDTDEMERGTG